MMFIDVHLVQQGICREGTVNRAVFTTTKRSRGGNYGTSYNTSRDAYCSDCYSPSYQFPSKERLELYRCEDLC